MASNPVLSLNSVRLFPEDELEAIPGGDRSSLSHFQAAFTNLHTEVHRRSKEERPQLPMLKSPATGPSLLVAPVRETKQRKSVVGADVQEAWMKRGWTLHTQIASSGDENLKDLVETTTTEADPDIQDLVHDRQARLHELTEVNKQLHGVLVKKKAKEHDLRGKIDVLLEKLTAACGVEKRARDQSEAALEERILTEEREKQDMQFALSQEMRAREEGIAKVKAANDALAETNGQNKKLMKEQQAQIKERQKAIRHLQRQILVLEGSKRKSANQDSSLDQTFLHNRNQSLLDADDGDGVLHSQREKAKDSGDSKGLLRGARAQNYLKEEKRRIQAQKLETKDLTTKNATRTMAEIKALPGLDLNMLLGLPPAAAAEKST